MAKKRMYIIALAILLAIAVPAFCSGFGAYNQRSGGGSAPSFSREIVAASSGELSKTQATHTIVTNYGQGEVFNTQLLPDAAEGLDLDVVIGTTRSGSVFALQAQSSDKIYLDGSAGDDGGFVSTTPAISTTIRLLTFQTGSTTYDWIATTGSGTWTAGGELHFAYEDDNIIIAESGNYLSVE